MVGLARSGLAAVRVLLEFGEVLATDSGAPELPADFDALEVELETDGIALLKRVRTIVKSPGVPRDAPVIAEGLRRGLDVIGELELGWRLLGGEFVAVTGTNGKTTTTELLGAIHREAGIDVAVAGNVGTPLTALVGGPAPDVVVCECSSFQLEDAPRFAPEAALLLNLDEDHLDRHGTLAAYRKAKLSMFSRQRPVDIACAPVGIDPGGPAQRVLFGGPGAALELCDETLVWHGDPLLATGDVRLRGAHNLENAMGAAAVALARGIDRDAVRAGLRNFAGVEHRLEEVAERGGVLYVNDSKATNVASAVAGIGAFDGGVHAILGGSLKGGGFDGLRRTVAERCRAVYLIGEAADRLAADLADTVEVRLCTDLENAVRGAAGAAAPGEVVLLSPACASFDQFRDYEQRGERFRSAVRRLEESS